jgi:predicted ATP-grasp superfamily ATP-dependent carboligase
MRTLGSLGVPVYTLDHQEPSIAAVSRFCAGRIRAGLHGRPEGCSEDEIVEQLRAAGGALGEGTVLVAASDAWARFLASHSEELDGFAFPRVPVSLIKQLSSKEGLVELAAETGLCAPRMRVADTIETALSSADEIGYPIVLKPESGAEVTLARDEAELTAQLAGAGESGVVVLQEYLGERGGDVWMFNGYFDERSRCLAGFTSRKLRQKPFELGVCSYGVCETNRELARISESFLGDMRYRGLVDIDYVWDPTDASYKILDVNPRLGGAFRLMVDRNGLDVVRAMYLDLTGREVPTIVPQEGRTWLFESCELLEYRHYRRERGLRFVDWVRSLRDADEGATFSISDPAPFLMSMGIVLRDTFKGRVSRLLDSLRRGGQTAGLLTVSLLKKALP